MKSFSRIASLVMVCALFALGAHVFGAERNSAKNKSEKASKEKDARDDQAAKDEDVIGESSDKDDVFGTVFPRGTKVYTACNLWYEKPNALWCINYKRGEILPAGTAVRGLRIAPGQTGSGRGKATIFFTSVQDGKVYQLHFEPIWHPKFTIRDYANRLFTTKSFEELTEGMTEKEIGAIKDGKLKVGMSKKAVLASWGYPPEHKTKSLDEDVWVYWTTRFRNKPIYFDKNGKTRREPGLEPDEL